MERSEDAEAPLSQERGLPVAGHGEAGFRGEWFLAITAKRLTWPAITPGYSSLGNVSGSVFILSSSKYAYAAA